MIRIALRKISDGIQRLKDTPSPHVELFSEVALPLLGPRRRVALLPLVLN
jgi:hypothetical protein